MVDIEIINYESIKHAHIKVDGFTVVTGRNHLGKSAVLRAINAALTNEQGTQFINWDAKYAEIKIKAKDLDLTWHKEEGNNFYIVNGKRLEKVGNEPPPSAISNAGLGLITAGNEKINLHYAEQFFPLFLVDRRDSKTADLLISIYGLDRLYKSSELCSKDIRKNKSLLKTRQADLESAQRDISRFDGFESVIEIKKQLIAHQKEIFKLESDVNNFKDLLISYQTLAQEYTKAKAVEKVTVPEYMAINDFYTELGNLKNLSNSLFEIARSLKRIEPIQKVQIKDTEEIAIKKEEIKDLKELCNMYDNIKKEAQHLEKVKEVSIPEIDFDSEIENLEKMQGELILKATEVRTIETQIKEVDNRIKNISSQLDKFDKCPACGADL